MQLLRKLLLAAGFGALFAMSVAASAASVTCGNAGLGLRQFTVDPALVGGLCYAQNGNFIGDDFSVAGLVGSVVLDKDSAFPDVADALHVSALSNSGTAGTWSFTATLWNTYDRLFLAAHYGGGGDTSVDNPDSFIVELSPFFGTGTFALTGVGIQLTGLSNLYLVGIRCQERENCNCPPEDPNCGDIGVPEPGTLLLLGTVALGLATRRRLFA